MPADSPHDTPRSPTALPLPSPAERERTIDLLTRHFAEDRLAMEEFERRVAAVYAARTTPEMHALVADLPALAGGPASVLSAESAAGIAPASGRIGALFSSQERQGSWLVPRHLRVVAVFGSVELDLREATFAPGTTEVDVSTVFGSVELRVPPGVRIECEGGAILGSFDARGGDLPLDDAATVVRVTGRAIFASVEVRGALAHGGRRELEG